MTLACKELDEIRVPDWDRFVEATSAATFFHRAGWKTVMEKAFGHTPRFLYTERDGSISGILPLAHMNTRLFGNSVVSLPFCVYGGPVALDTESEAALHRGAEALMEQSKADVLEYRQGPVESGSVPSNDDNWQTRSDLYVTFRKIIEASDDANLKAIPRKQRAMVRKGIDHGLQSKSDQDVDLLHKIYAESVRNLGTPVFARRYFRLLAEVFQSSMDVVTVRDGDLPIAAVMNFYFRDEVIPYYGGGTKEARGRYGNDFMYWEVMRKAAAHGARMFDFGRSKVGTGSFSFKKNWGFVPQPLQYRYKTKPGKAVPDHSPLNPKYRLMISTWKKLPLPVANMVGPFVVRGIG